VHKAANYDVRDVAKMTSTSLESVMEDVSINKVGVKSRDVKAAVLEVFESVRRAYLQAISDAYLDSVS
jgi:3-methyladenine DNA glycosylase Tag